MSTPPPGRRLVDALKGGLPSSNFVQDQDGRARHAREIVDYRIEARLDTTSKTLTGTETLTYENRTGRPLSSFPFHLYLNGFQDGSSWIQEGRRELGQGWDEYLKTEHRGSIAVSSITVDGQGDVTTALRFIAPDDGNQSDRTVFEVSLPKPVPPLSKVVFHIAFRAKFPKLVARAGYRNDFIMGAQWFPKIGVWWKGSWNCHQYHYASEFFADFGSFDVKLKLPANYVIGATGQEIRTQKDSDGTTTHDFQANDVHDFAWAVSPHFKLFDAAWTSSSGRRTKLIFLMQPQHSSQVPRQLQILRHSLDYFDRWYGAYPYSTLTVVDSEDLGPGGVAGGMEYPTLITASTLTPMPTDLLGLPEAELVHEFGHQYWYGLVATNEMEEAWLDEGIDTYCEMRTMDDLYGRDASLINHFLGATAGERGFQRLLYLSAPSLDSLAQEGWKYISKASYASISYAKTAAILSTLEDLIGPDAVQRALKTYFTQYRFEHPTGADLIRVVETTSNRNLEWFFSKSVYSTKTLDYGIRGIKADPWNIWGGPAGMYRNYITVERKGDFIYPTTVAVRFADGETIREHWDGVNRWARYTYDRRAKISSAEVDPDNEVMLDSDLFNNSRTLTPHPAAARKLSNYLLFASGALSSLLASFI